MYFKDFTPYCYGTYYGRDRVISLEEVLMIGWLENGYSYPQGEVDEQTLFTLQKLFVLAPKSAIWHKGFHYCDYCNLSVDTEIRPKITFEGEQLILGSREIWLPSATTPQVIYAAPNLIYHYIVEHRYRPPDVFLEAVNSFDIASEWDASKQFWSLLEKTRARIRDQEQGT